MCVIPVYYITAPGQNQNEYSHTAHPFFFFESVNTDIVVAAISAEDDAICEHSLDDVCCYVYAFVDLNVFFFFYTGRGKKRHLWSAQTLLTPPLITVER